MTDLLIYFLQFLQRNSQLKIRNALQTRELEHNDRKFYKDLCQYSGQIEIEKFERIENEFLNSRLEKIEFKYNH